MEDENSLHAEAIDDTMQAMLEIDSSNAKGLRPLYRYKQSRVSDQREEKKDVTREYKSGQLDPCGKTSKKESTTRMKERMLAKKSKS